MVHQYGYGREDDATHHYRQHPHSAPPLGAMPMAKRQGSMGSVYPPVMEENEEPFSAPMEKANYLDPYSQPDSGRLSKNPSNISTRSGHGGPNRFANMFHFSSSADPSKQEVRGGSHRGTKDYPHLQTRDFAMEHEERAALVDTDGPRYGRNNDSDDEDEGKRRSYEEEPRSAVTDESMGHVFLAEVRPAPIAKGRPSTVFEDGERTPTRGSPKGPRSQF